MSCRAFDVTDPGGRKFPFGSLDRNGAGSTPAEWDEMVDAARAAIPFRA